MASSAATALVTNSHAAYKALNGIICIYKPLGWGMFKVVKVLKGKLCEDLNQMERAPRQEIVDIRRTDGSEYNEPKLENEQVVQRLQDGQKQIEIVKGLGYADHPLVAGPSIKPEDIKMVGTGPTLGDVSGVHLYGINRGIGIAQRIYHSRWIRTYLVSGRFGIATDTYFHTGRIIQKVTYGNIKRHVFEHLLSSVQSSHQRLSFLSSGVPLDSEQAYELASQGVVRPEGPSATVIYSLKCIAFKPPDFTIEVKAINDDCEYLKRLVFEIATQLKSVATCTKIQCINQGPFELDDAILMKHWNLQSIFNNINRSRDILKNFNMNERDLWVSKMETEENDRSSEEMK